MSGGGGFLHRDDVAAGHGSARQLDALVDHVRPHRQFMLIGPAFKANIEDTGFNLGAYPFSDKYRRVFTLAIWLFRHLSPQFLFSPCGKVTVTPVSGEKQYTGKPTHAESVRSEYFVMRQAVAA